MKILKLTKKHHKKAAALLAIAFLKDPLYNYFTKGIKEEKTRKKAITEILSADIERHLERGDPVYGIKKGKKLVGLISMQNFAKAINPFYYIKVFFRLIKKGIGIFVIFRILKYAAKTHSFFPKDTNYITLLAVHPKHQRKGIGSKLMNFMVKYGKKLNPTHRIALATNKKKNLEFYKKAGYELKGKKRFGIFTKHYLQKGNQE